jgi:hypothetical protein
VDRRSHRIPRRQSALLRIEGFAEAVHHLDRFSHDLRADAITGQHCDLHFELL